MSTYKDLVEDSLKAASMENSLQTGAVYWEFGNYDFLPRRYSSTPTRVNFSLMGNISRSAMGNNTRITQEPFVFYGDKAYVRKYHAEPDSFEIVPMKKDYRFTLFPTGTRDIYEGENKSSQVYGTHVFNEILKSAIRVDLLHNMKSTL